MNTQKRREIKKGPARCTSIDFEILHTKRRAYVA